MESIDHKENVLHQWIVLETSLVNNSNPFLIPSHQDKYDPQQLQIHEHPHHHHRLINLQRMVEEYFYQ
jgi:hypothetical protein